jgi:hypothetical protein
VTGACGARRCSRPCRCLAADRVLLPAPRDYYTGTDNVEVYTYIVETPAGEPVCVPGLSIPAGTGRLRLQLISRTRVRPALKLALTLAGPARTIDSRSPPSRSAPAASATAVFTIPDAAARPAKRQGVAVRDRRGRRQLGRHAAAGGAEPLSADAGGRPLAGRIAVWYLPRAGAQRSYLARGGEILRRASLFRPALVGPWLYVLILLVALPALALASVRCLALAAALPGGHPPRRLAAWLFADRRDQLRLLGAHHAAVPGARRGRPLRLHAVARRTRRSAVAQPRLAAGALVEL